jgi:hypothetical protein
MSKRVRKRRLKRNDGVKAHYNISDDVLYRNYNYNRHEGAWVRKEVIPEVPRKAFYRTLVSLSYYPREAKREGYTRICQYYVSVVSDFKDKYSVMQLEDIEKHLSLIMSMSSRRSDIRWKGSVYDVSEPYRDMTLASEDNVRIDWDELEGKKLNYIYRSAIFFRRETSTEYGEARVKDTEKMLNESGNLDTYLDNESGRIKPYHGPITRTVEL